MLVDDDENSPNMIGVRRRALQGGGDLAGQGSERRMPERAESEI